MDERLEELEANENNSILIDSLRLKNFRFFEEGLIECNGNHVLVYGENGTGKSSIYRALEYLAKKDFSKIIQDKNIFLDENPEIEFVFSNGDTLILNRDLEKIPEGFEYLNDLSIFLPFLNFKKLLRVHYTTTGNGKPINLFSMLEELFKDYPIDNNVKLSDIADPDSYFTELQKIVNDILLTESNKLLGEIYFDSDIKINKFTYKREFANDKQTIEPVIHLDLDFKEKELTSYHHFLNEGRLTALAVSLYFSAIKTIHSKSKSHALNILVLDDILLSFDTNNRDVIKKILLEEFSDFQVFFFTHEKELYEFFKDDTNLLWEQFEIITVDKAVKIPNNEEVEEKYISVPLVRKSKTYIDRAELFFNNGELEVAANLLRKELENSIKKYFKKTPDGVTEKESRSVQVLITKLLNETNNQSIKEILREIIPFVKIMLHRGSHGDSKKAIYRDEVKRMIQRIEKLNQLLG